MTADREAGEPSNERGFKFQSEENRGTGLKSVVFLVVLLVDVFFLQTVSSLECDCLPLRLRDCDGALLRRRPAPVGVEGKGQEEEEGKEAAKDRHFLVPFGCSGMYVLREEVTVFTPSPSAWGIFHPSSFSKMPFGPVASKLCLEISY